MKKIINTLMEIEDKHRWRFYLFFAILGILFGYLYIVGVKIKELKEDTQKLYSEIYIYEKQLKELQDKTVILDYTFEK